MNTRLILCLSVAGLLLTGCSTSSLTAPGSVTAADITVEFQNPDGFRDARDSFGGATDEHALATLRAYLQENAPGRLQTGQKLRVTFTDIDLAGDFPGTGGGQFDRVRIIKGIYIPRQEISFTLTDAAGKVLKEGTRVLMDMNFQAAASRIGSDRAYFYDTMLLEDWLRKEFK
jgi:hypothetical protein